MPPISALRRLKQEEHEFIGIPFYKWNKVIYCLKHGI
jgi:hypothetical protein